MLTLVQAALLAHVVAGVFLRGLSLGASLPWLMGLVLAFCGRAAATWLVEVSGHRAASEVRSHLRMELAGRLLARPLGAERTGELVHTLAGGMDALDAYYSRYLPQLVAAVAVPLAVLGWTAPRDHLSAGIIALTMPLVLLFMVLIGIAARQSTDRRWLALSILSAHLLDVVQGLPTLRLFGRAKAQQETIERVAEQHRLATMATLRDAFLSSLVLELVAMVSTAMVAVGIGLRLAYGALDLETGLAFLILTPEVYLPLRRLGTQYHASMDALAPAGRIFELLEDAAALSASGGAAPDLKRDVIRLEGVRFAYPNRGEVLAGIDLELRPGEHVALIGPSGAGKSTLLSLLLGFETPSAGLITVGGRPMTELSILELRAQIAWLPQRPQLFAGTVDSNIRFGDASLPADRVELAAGLAGLDLSLQAQVGEHGRLLSGGQRQRIGLARAVARGALLLLLDEPAAHLDREAQARIAALLHGPLRGTTVLLATHSPLLAAACQRAVTLEEGRMVGVAEVLQVAM